MLADGGDKVQLLLFDRVDIEWSVITAGEQLVKQLLLQTVTVCRRESVEVEFALVRVRTQNPF